MSEQRHTSRDILESLRRGALVLAPTNQAAHAGRRLYDEEQRAAGQPRWQPPKIRTWTAWLQEMWRELVLSGITEQMLLSTDQEHAVWREVIAADALGEASLVGIDGLAELARAAAQRLSTFCGSRAALTAAQERLRRVSPYSADERAFVRWSAAFRELASGEAWLTTPELPLAIGDALRSGALRPGTAEVHIAGSGKLTPAQHGLLDSLRHAGVAVSLAAAAPRADEAAIACAVDEREELRACIRWCAARVRAGRRVAIIAPELNSLRPNLARLLREEFARPGEGGALFASGLPRVGFAALGALSAQPMIRAALDLLRLSHGVLSLEAVSELVRSPYVAIGQGEDEGTDRDAGALREAKIGRAAATPEGEASARAAFDAYELRRKARLRPEISLDELVAEVRGSRRSDGLNRLTRALRKLQMAAAKRTGGRQSYAEWAETFRRLLAAAGWGAGEAQTEAEAETQALWDGTLDTLATMSFLGRRIDFAAALGDLARIVSRRSLALAMSEAPLQAMTPEEAAGCDFDALWCLRAGELQWPVRGTAAALLPWALQRDHGMPGTDPARDAAASAELLESLCGAAAEVVFSYAEHTSSRSPQRATPSLRGLRLRERAGDELAGVATAEQRVQLEPSPDIVGVPFVSEGLLAGGAEVLRKQALCPFRAFAEHRLWSSGPETAMLGLDRREAGNVVHKVLENLWKELKTHDRLVALTSSERGEILDRILARELDALQPSPIEAWGDCFLAMQRRRLSRLLEDWLAVEARRPAFAVLQQERRIDDARIGPLRLSLRIDRIDLVNGARVLIDYKTGAGSKVGDWTGDRPDAPQVPLYAVLAARSDAEETRPEQQPLGGVAFAKVLRGKEAKIEGLAAHPGVLRDGDEGVARDFGAEIRQWSVALEALAHEFAAGRAVVRPKTYPKTCTTCEQRMLCRLDPAMLTTEDSDGDEDAQDGEDG